MQGHLNVRLIMVSSTCFEHPNVHPQEDLYIEFCGISFMHHAIHQTAYMDA